MLSDSCFDFLDAPSSSAASQLADDVDHYSESPFAYSPETIIRLRRACADAIASEANLPALVAVAHDTLREVLRLPGVDSE